MNKLKMAGAAGVVAAISHNINEDPFWSFFILNRRQIKTECLILAPKK